MLAFSVIHESCQCSEHASSHQVTHYTHIVVNLLYQFDCNSLGFLLTLNNGKTGDQLIFWCLTTVVFPHNSLKVLVCC